MTIARYGRVALDQSCGSVDNDDARTTCRPRGRSNGNDVFFRRGRRPRFGSSVRRKSKNKRSEKNAGQTKVYKYNKNVHIHTRTRPLFENKSGPFLCYK